jgi:hypothetical protein
MINRVITTRSATTPACAEAGLFLPDFLTRVPAAILRASISMTAFGTEKVERLWLG